MVTKQRKTIADYYTPTFLARLDSTTCQHEEPRGARYCAACRFKLARWVQTWRPDEQVVNR